MVCGPKHSSSRGWPKLPPPGVLALCHLRTHAVKEVSDRHFENSSYSPFEIHICCGKQLAKQPGSSPTFGSSYELQTIWTESNYKSNRKPTCKKKNARSTNVHRATTQEFAGIQPSCVTSSRHNHRDASDFSCVLQFAFDQSSICFISKLVRLRNDAEFGYLTLF